LNDSAGFLPNPITWPIGIDPKADRAVRVENQHQFQSTPGIHNLRVPVAGHLSL
jgi:hypothetical protein